LFCKLSDVFTFFLTTLFSYLLTGEPVLISKIASLFDMHTVLGCIAVQGMFLSVGLLSDTEWSSSVSVRYPVGYYLIPNGLPMCLSVIQWVII
jgi:hypothetical protein